MRTLVVGTTTSQDKEICRALRTGGNEARRAENVLQAGDYLDAESFDCILINIPAFPDREKPATLVAMRRLVMAASVVLMTESPVETLAEDALADGSILLVPEAEVERFISRNDSAESVLLAGSRSNPQLLDRLKAAYLRAIAANSLPFALNTLADGWCDAVLLNVTLPGLAMTDKTACFEAFAPQHLAVLASGIYETPSGIPCVQKPIEPMELLSIMKHTVASRPVPCGWVASRRHLGSPREA